MKRSAKLLSVFLILLTCICLFSVLPGSEALAASPHHGLDGVWKGVLAGHLHLIVRIKRNDGKCAGVLLSVDQGNGQIPIESATLNGNKVRFELKTIGGIYDATVNKAFTELRGTWTQTASGTSKQLLMFSRTKSVDFDIKPMVKATKPISAPLEIKIPVVPTAFNASGKIQLVYELQVANFQQTDCTVTELEVISLGKDKIPIAKFRGATLEGLAFAPGRPNLTEKTKIGPGNLAIFFVWLSIDSLKNEPVNSICHRLRMRIGEPAEEMEVQTVAIPVENKNIDQIDSPLKGGDWLAANGPSNSSRHRRALIPINGSIHIGQRFAIDWVRLYSNGKTFHGDPKSNKSYSAYGAEVLSATNGTVSEVKDQIPENIPGIDSRAVPMTLESLGGNHVGVDLGNGHFAFYCHLQPGSIRVKPGDVVSSGQVLGLLGNSGNSTEPHLHFQICNANSTLDSEGVPYSCTFEKLTKEISGTEANNAPGVKVTGMPMENDVVRFMLPPIQK